MKVAFIAGGSGGHIIPALAVADVLQKSSPKTEIFFVSADHELDANIFAAHQTAYRRLTISTGKWRRYFSFQNFLDPFRFFSGFFQSYRLLRRERPNLIFSKGGYVALPVGFAAKFLGIPLIIHESDTIPGRANRILQRMAVQTLTTFPAAEGIWVGTPVRGEIAKGDALRGRQFLNFPHEEKIILVMGGSQGAETINQLLLHALSALLNKTCIVHLSGEGKSAAKDSARYRRFSYLGKDFPDVLAAADIVVARAGANTLFEIALTGKPAILIPLSSAANNHQKANAEYFRSQGAAQVLSEQDLNSAIFQEKILALLQDQETQKALRENVQKLARPDAAEHIVRIILHFDRQMPQ